MFRVVSWEREFPKLPKFSGEKHFVSVRLAPWFSFSDFLWLSALRAITWLLKKSTGTPKYHKGINLENMEENLTVGFDLPADNIFVSEH